MAVTTPEVGAPVRSDRSPLACVQSPMAVDADGRFPPEGREEADAIRMFAKSTSIGSGGGAAYTDGDGRGLASPRGSPRTHPTGCRRVSWNGGLVHGSHVVFLLGRRSRISRLIRVAVWIRDFAPPTPLSASSGITFARAVAAADSATYQPSTPRSSDASP
ncbi:MAG: hypothetical protein EXR69_04535 [Myxococcales bacterium]|nr:hypothetical protein [Myxococcales bacterium]